MFPIKALIGAIAGFINVIITAFCIGRMSVGGTPSNWEFYVIPILTIISVWSFMSPDTTTK